MKIALGTIAAHNLFEGSIDGYLQIAELADKAGIDQIVFTDHVIMSENTDKYPFGEFPLPLDYPWFEPLSLLSAIAAVTENIRLATGILISPLRPASLLAKTCSTIDVLSNGRLDLGVGTGWQKEEYDAQRIDFSERNKLLDEQLDILHKLWNEAPATIVNSSADIQSLYSIPQPIQSSGIPLWFGMAANEANAERIAKHGNGWIPIKTTNEFIRKGVDVISEALERNSRSANELMVRAHAVPEIGSDGAPCLEKAKELAHGQIEAGATHIEFEVCAFCRTRDDIPAFLESIAELKS